MGQGPQDHQGAGHRSPSFLRWKTHKSCSTAVCPRLLAAFQSQVRREAGKELEPGQRGGAGAPLGWIQFNLVQYSPSPC